MGCAVRGLVGGQGEHQMESACPQQTLSCTSSKPQGLKNNEISRNKAFTREKNCNKTNLLSLSLPLRPFPECGFAVSGSI